MVCFTREERLRHAKEEFKDLEEPISTDNEWMKLSEVDKHGFYRATIGNTALILENNPYLKDKIALCEFSHRTMIRWGVPWHKLINSAEGDPWKDSDDTAVKQFISKR